MSVNDCVFCSIERGESPASIVYEDDLVLAFLDIRPVNDGHTLVIPRRHDVTLADLEEDTAARMFSVARRVAGAVRSSPLRCEGVNLFYADGEAAFQEVFHSHLHVVPRWVGDGFTIDANFDPGATREQLDAHAEAIRSALP